MGTWSDLKSRFSKLTRAQTISSSIAVGLVVVVGVSAALWYMREESMLDPPVSIAVCTDSPGMCYQAEANQRTGFDVFFYRWIASEAEPAFVPTESDVNIEDRINVLRSNQAGLVFASFTITSERERQVDFSAPYMTTRQGVLVRAGTSIASVQDLSFKSVCAQSESTSVAELRQLPNVRVVERIGLDQCVEELESGAVDAVSTDQILLYGWANVRSTLTVVPNLYFGAIGRYGIGLPPGPGTERCEEMNEWVRRFIDRGAWDTAFRNNFGENVDPTSFRPETKNMRPCVDDDDDG